MTSRPAVTCAHDLRPGTTVCLYCRAEERTLVRARRRRAAVRALGAAGGAVAVVGLLFAGVSALRGGNGAGDASAASTADAHPIDSASTAAAAISAPSQATPQPAPGTSPLVPAGRTALGNGLFVDREGDVVVVNFDMQGSRTRRADKFETVVRATLPAVLGDAGRSALAQVEPGALIPPGGLLTAAGQAALELPVGDGRVIRLTPQARMGQDGPLVVTYRAVLDLVAESPAS